MSSNREVVSKMTPGEKLEMIRTGKRKRSLTGVKENKNITFENKGGKFVAVQKEKKFEEAGVTKKKKNFVMFESKLGTETETDLTQIAGPKKVSEVKPRVDERIVQTKKRIEYLDNYQYKETKEFGKHPKPSIVVHTRLGDIIGGSFEQSSYQKITTSTGARGNSASKTTTKTETTTKTLKENKSSANLRTKPKTKEGSESSATATKTMVSTTKVGRRGGAGGAHSTTTETTSKTTTTRTTRRGAK